MTTKTEQAKHIANTIKVLRDSFKWTQAKLAQEAGISGAALSKIEKGEGRIPTIVVLRKLAAALKVQVYEITGEESAPVDETQARNKEFYRQWDVLDGLSDHDKKILRDMAERLKELSKT